MGRLVVAVMVSSWVIPISILINRIVPEPYMDEIFHIPQAQQYCNGNFKSWDPMITTPPGLYYISLAHVASLFPGMFLLHWNSSIPDVCSTAVLRSTNGALSIICSILIYEIITTLRPTLDQRKATLRAVILALYPLHWFFNYLYYTDVASLTLFLASYLTCLRKNYWFSAMLGALAVFVRQTNIVWMLFVACGGVIDLTFSHQRDNVRVVHTDFSIREKVQLTPWNDFSRNQGLKRRKLKGDENIADPYVPSETTTSSIDESGLLKEIHFMVVQLWHLKWELLISFSPFLLVLASFAAFVHWNGSVVLGAKEAHTVSPHFAQLMYFALVSALFSAPFHFNLGRAGAITQLLWNNKSLSIFLGFVALVAGLLSVHFFSIAHPYLLADNRHYPFYLWRKIIKAHWSAKYLLVSLYLYSWFSILSFLERRRRIWVLAYFLVTAAALVPAPLIEFRYYTIPFFVYMLNCEVEEDHKWLLTGILYIAVNVFTMSMFLFSPFRWAHEPGVQRFIW